MKPAPFAYEAPTSVEETVALLAEHGDEAVVLAGGQSLIPLLNLRLAQPDVVVDINRVSGLGHIVVNDEGVNLGALCRASELESNTDVRASLPVLRDAVRHV